MTNRTDDDIEVEVSSPVCSMHEADDAYMGYASKNELIAFLNELLEVERAGARATLESAPIAGNYRIAELLRTVQRDETRWCAMLSGHIKALGEVPSRRVGAFYGKATAMGGLGDRITFLSRGQRWVVRKLREMLPRVRNDQLHADLYEMLRSHEGNITLVNDLVASISGGEKRRRRLASDRLPQCRLHGRIERAEKLRPVPLGCGRRRAD